MSDSCHSRAMHCGRYWRVAVKEVGGVSASTPTPRSRRDAGSGAVRRLPSGRYQARLQTDDGSMSTVPAPHTFATKREASGWLAETVTDRKRGVWGVDPRPANAMTAARPGAGGKKPSPRRLCVAVACGSPSGSSERKPISIPTPATSPRAHNCTGGIHIRLDGAGSRAQQISGAADQLRSSPASGIRHQASQTPPSRITLERGAGGGDVRGAVSYTHLTLPTKRIV